MKITEKKLNAKRRKVVADWVVETQSLVEELQRPTTPEEWVDLVQQAVESWQAGSPPDYQGEVVLEDLHLLLGTVWGDQICKVHGWEWVSLHFVYPGGKWDADGIVSPDRSLYVLPYAHVLECAGDPDIDVCIAGSLRVIGTSVVPRFPAKGYKDLMSGLRHIVPTNVR